MALAGPYTTISEELAALYPAGTDEQARRATWDLLGDRMFTWACSTGARMQARTGAAPVYLFRWQPSPPIPGDAGLAERNNAGAFHGAEVPYVFGTFAARAWPWTAGDRRPAPRGARVRGLARLRPDR